MNEVKIFFIILGTFFMREQPSLVAEKSIVAIDPLKKEVIITQQNLISATDIKDVSQTEEYQILKGNGLNWVKELESFRNKKISIEDKEGKVSAILSFNYDEPKDLEAINISYSKDFFHVFQEENLEVLTGKHQIEEADLLFSSQTPFSFSISIFEEWIDPKSEKVLFNQELLNQPLVRKKSDDIKGRTYTQVDNFPEVDEKPSFTKNGLTLFFAEDQDFALVNDNEEIEVKYLDNNTVLVPIPEGLQNIQQLKKGDNYFVYKVDEIGNTMTLIPSDKFGKVSSEEEIYFSIFSEQDN